MKTKIKTIDIQAKEWFDKVNGNSYFSGVITINYGTKSEELLLMPFQYGYGSQFEQEARQTLANRFFLTIDRPLSYYCRENKIILRTNKQENCLKRDVVAFGK